MKKFELISAQTEIAQVNCASLKGMETFNIYTYAKEFMSAHGYDSKSDYSYSVDFAEHIIHVYAITIKEVEL